MRNHERADLVATPANDSAPHVGELVPRGDEGDRIRSSLRRTTRQSKVTEISIETTTTTEEMLVSTQLRNA